MFIFKRICLMIIIIFTSVFIGLAAMLSVYSLPTEPMFRHVKQNISMYENEGDRPYLFKRIKSTQLDYFTDSIMLMNAIFPADNNLLDRSMLIFRWGTEKEEGLVATLIQNVKNTSKTQIVTYERYWHGYLVPLKAALLITGPKGIRILNGILQTILLLFIINIINKKFGKNCAYAFLAMVIVLNPISTAMCFQFSSMYYLTLGASMFLLLKNESLKQKDNYYFFFLLIGIIAAFLDFLTYPLLTLGVPLLLYALLNYKTLMHIDRKTHLKKQISYALAWGFGYAGMWFGKWLIATILTDRNVLQDAFHSIQFRTSTTAQIADGVKNLGLIRVVFRNLEGMGKGPLCIVLIVALLYFIYWLYKNHNCLDFHCNAFTDSLLFCGLLPFLWYGFIQNHSFVHAFFTYRSLGITVLAILIWVNYLSEQLKTQGRLDKKLS